MKYVVLQIDTQVGNSEHTHLLPIIFPNYMVHSEVYENFKTYYETNHNTEYPCSITSLSGGDYCTIRGSCSGRSDSLKVSSRNEEDTNLIRTLDYTGGIV